MAKKDAAKFVDPDGAARQAEAAKTLRLRAMRLAKEAEDAVKAEKDAVILSAAAELRKPRSRRRVAAADPPVPPT